MLFYLPSRTLLTIVKPQRFAFIYCYLFVQTHFATMDKISSDRPRTVFAAVNRNQLITVTENALNYTFITNRFQTVIYTHSVCICRPCRTSCISFTNVKVKCVIIFIVVRSRHNFPFPFCNYWPSRYRPLTALRCSNRFFFFSFRTHLAKRVYTCLYPPTRARARVCSYEAVDVRPTKTIELLNYPVRLRYLFRKRYSSTDDCKRNSKSINFSVYVDVSQ